MHRIRQSITAMEACWKRTLSIEGKCCWLYICCFPAIAAQDASVWLKITLCQGNWSERICWEAFPKQRGNGHIHPTKGGSSWEMRWIALYWQNKAKQWMEIHFLSCDLLDFGLRIWAVEMILKRGTFCLEEEARARKRDFIGGQNRLECGSHRI